MVAEARKLTAEAEYLARPFWQRTEALGLLGSLLVAAVGLGGVIWAESIKAELEKLHRQEADAQQQQARAAEQVTAAIVAKANADKAVKTLKPQIDQLKSERDGLQIDARYWKIDALLDQMKIDTAHSDASLVDRAIRDFLKSSSAADKPRLIARCEQRANAAADDAPRFRLFVYNLLSQETRDPRFKMELIQFAEDYVFATPGRRLSEATLWDYQNIIRGYIIPNTLGEAECRFLALALWERKLEFGGNLKTVPYWTFADFIGLNRRALLEYPEAYYLTVAEVQRRLLVATNSKDIANLAHILGVHAPQCLVLTWYFSQVSSNWKAIVQHDFEDAESTLRNRDLTLSPPIQLMPTPSDDRRGVSAEDWKTTHPKLVRFWVPVNYDPATYDPAIQAILRRDSIRESDVEAPR